MSCNEVIAFPRTSLMDIIAGTRTVGVLGSECNVFIIKSLAYLGTLLMDIITVS